MELKDINVEEGSKPEDRKPEEKKPEEKKPDDGKSVEGAKLNERAKRRKKTTARLRNKWSYFLTIFALCMNFFYYGYELVAFGTVLDNITPVMGWTDSQQTFYLTVISAMISAGNFLGSVLSPTLSQRFGRYKTLLLMVLVSYMGSILSAIATVPTLIIGRLLANISSGVFITISPIIAKELSPEELHSFSSAFIPYFTGFGIFLGFLLGLGNPDPSQTTNQYWRFLNLFGVIPATISCLILIFNTKGDSGKFIYNRYKNEELTRKALARVYKDDEIDNELKDIKKESEMVNTRFSVLSLYKNFRKQILIGLALSLSQVCAGLNYSGLYVHLMIQKTELEAGNTNESARQIATLFTTFCGISQVLGNTGSFYWLKRYRKKWLFVFIFGFAYIALGLNWLFGYIGLQTAQKYCVVLTFFASGAGMGQFGFLYSPNIMVGSAFSVVMGGFSGMRLIDTIIFPILLDSELGVRCTLLIYWGIGMLASLYWIVTAVEIKGVSQAEVLKRFYASIQETETNEKDENLPENHA